MVRLGGHPIKVVVGSINSDIMSDMADMDSIVARMRANPKGIAFNDLCKVCDAYFGEVIERLEVGNDQFC